MNSAPRTLVEVENLSFRYPNGDWLFQNANFELKSGEILAILGPNGCGKSSLLDVLLGLNQPNQGQARMPQAVSFVSQFFSSAFDYSVLDMVLMGRSQHIGLFGKPKPEDITMAKQCLARLQMSHLTHRPFNQLSGGQKQMILIARAIATESPIMVLDEPTSALDLFNQNHLLSLLKELAAENGLAIIFTTHQPDHALAVAHKTLLMTKPTPTFGATKQVLTNDNLSALFRLPILQNHLHYQGQPIDHFTPIYDSYLNNE